MIDSHEQVMKEQASFVNWVKSLSKMSNEQWFMPYSEGKWSSSEIISHLLSWDQFLISLNIMKIQEGDVLPSFPPIQEVNEKAAHYAREIVSKDELIHQFVETRKRYMNQLSTIGEEDYSRSFKIGTFEFTILSLIEDFQGHDHHHQKQIQLVLSQ
ncbi:DinB family protein [Bacillus salitolerans]|uniref:DinB family protein n=1 Tax=Bacillus salitolerans TaxID=1437434 RepID=A0ABW4LKG2_9BACI